MATVSQKMMDALRDAAADQIDHAMVNVEGELKSYLIHKIHKTLNEFIAYVYIDDVEAQGVIRGAFLVDTAGDSLMSHDMLITKGDSGLLIAFQFKLKVEVAIQ